MKRFILCFSLLSLLLFPLFSDTWGGGYRIGLSGYVDDSHSENEHFSSSLIFTPYLSSQGAVELYGGITCSTLLYSPSTFYVKGGISLSHLISQRSPLDALLIRDSAWWGQVDVNISTSLSTPSSWMLEGKVAPFTLFFGDKYISVASLLLTYDLQDSTIGWGVSLFELTHYLW